MRKLLLTTAAVAAAIAGTFAAEPSFGTFTDTRDGQTYKTVKIGKQTWMAQNLNYKTDSSWCYNDSLSYCKKYGRLYNWETAKKACPAGYYLPSRHEWDDLVQTVGGERRNDMGYADIVWYGAGDKLKAKSDWKNHIGQCNNVSDDYGFSAMPGGERNGSRGSMLDNHYISGGNFIGVRVSGNGWSATDYDSSNAYFRKISGAYLFEVGRDKNFGHSVRCVADTP